MRVSKASKQLRASAAMLCLARVSARSPGCSADDEDSASGLHPCSGALMPIQDRVEPPNETHHDDDCQDSTQALRRGRTVSWEGEVALHRCRRSQSSRLVLANSGASCSN